MSRPVRLRQENTNIQTGNHQNHCRTQELRLTAKAGTDHFYKLRVQFLSAAVA